MKTALIIGDIQRGITGAYPFARHSWTRCFPAVPTKSCRVPSGSRTPRTAR